MDPPVTRAPAARTRHDAAAQAIAGTVTRSRLLDRLVGRVDRRLTLLVASAGFGKSTLLRQVLADAAVAAADDPMAPLDVVVTVPRDGSDVALLLGHLGRALVGAPLPGVAQVIDAVWSRAPRPVCLVIDDVQWLEPDAMSTIEDLLHGLPSNGHLLLSGREDPPIAYQRLVATGDADRLDEDDLAFDRDEVHAYAHLHGLPADGVGTSGWPALLELERLSGRSGAVRFLIEEVVHTIEPVRLHWCRRMSVHPTIDDHLVATATSFPGSAADLLAGVPLTVEVPATSSDRGAARTVHRVHDLVREALLAGLTPEERSDAAVAVGTALAERGDHDEALDRFVEAGRRDRVRWLARRLASQLHFADAANARQILAGRIREHLGDTLEAQVVDAVVASVEDPVRAAGPLRAAAERARRDDDADLEAACLLQLADIAYSAADLEQVTAARDRIVELAAGGCVAAARTSFLPEAWVRCLTDRHHDVVDLVDERRRTIDPVTDPELDQLLLLYRVLNLAYSGHVQAALDEAERLRNLPGGLFANRLAGFELIQRWHLGRLDPSWRTDVTSLVDRIESQGQVHLFLQGAAASALFHISTGDLETGRSLVERADRHLHRLAPTAWAHHSVALARAAIALCDGDEATAADILERAVPPRGIASLPRFIYGAAATLTYVLVPSTRPVWDADRGGPDHELRRDIARAIVAARDHGDTGPAAALPWDRPELIRPWAFGPHLVEVATAAIEAGVDAARNVIDTASHDPRGALVALSERADHPLAASAASLAASTPRRPTDAVEVRVLGPLELRRAGRPVTDDRWTRRQRVRDLLALLVHRRVVERTEIAVTLWPDKSAESASSNLRFTLSQLNGVLEPGRMPSDPAWFVRSVGSRVELLGRDRLSIDVDRFEEEVRAGTLDDRAGSPDLALEHYLAACSWYRGDYLAGASDPEWGFYDAIRIRGAYLEAATRAASLLASVGELDRAEEIAARAAAAEPFHEGAATTLARVLLSRHRPSAARDVLGGLLEELDRAELRPQPATRSLARRVGLDAPRP